MQFFQRRRREQCFQSCLLYIHVSAARLPTGHLEENTFHSTIISTAVLDNSIPKISKGHSFIYHKDRAEAGGNIVPRSIMVVTFPFTGRVLSSSKGIQVLQKLCHCYYNYRQ